MSSQKQFIRKISGHIPKGVARIFYTQALNSVRKKARERRYQAWARNSFVLGTWVPLQSDLDLTLFFNEKPEVDDLQRFSETLTGLKKFYPFLGEVNSYLGSELPRLSRVFNHFEVARDPDLLRKVGGVISNPLSLRAQASSFLLRMLEGDLQNVMEAPESRKLKWDFHEASVRSAVLGGMNPFWQDFPSRSLLRGILEAAVFLVIEDVAEATHAVESLEFYFEAAYRKLPVHFLTKDKESSPILAVFLPHRFCFGDLPSRGDYRELRGELFLAQLGWEILGIRTQHWLAQQTEKQLVSSHLIRISEIFGQVRSKLSPSARDQLLVIERLSSEVLVT